MATYQAYDNLRQTLYDWTWGWFSKSTTTTTHQSSQNATKSHKLLNLAAILRLVIEVHGYEMLINGCFNGDPHPGNILLLDDGRIGLIDYGQVKHLNPDQRSRLARTILALASGHPEKVVEAVSQQLQIRTKYMDPYVLEKYGRLMLDRDDRSITDGKNVQLFLEELEKRDPIVAQADDFVMAFRLSLLLRGLSYALRYDDMSHAKMWASLAEQVVREETREEQK
jgi:aarF domain-containing kinase